MRVTVNAPTKKLPARGRLSKKAYWVSTKRPIYGNEAVSADGYKFCWIRGRGYVEEHRLVVERAMGRRLRRKEIVHHIDGNKRNNKNDNLLVCSWDFHSWLHQNCLRKTGKWHLLK